MACPEISIKDKWLPEPLRETLKLSPGTHLGRAIREILRYVPMDMPSAREAAAELIDRLASCVVIESALYLKVVRGRLWRSTYSRWGERVEDHGLQSRKVVTTAGVNFLVDAWQNLVELEILKYHGLGTGAAAEASSDTALATELTTQYTGNVRATGSLTEGATANVLRSLGSNTLDETPGANLREHGLFSQAALGGGTLWDRSLLAGTGIAAVSGDVIATTYDVQFSAGG